MALLTYIEENKTSISDHNITEVTKTYSLDMEERNYGTEDADVRLSGLYFH